MFVKMQIPRPLLIYSKLESQEVLAELENDCIKCWSSNYSVWKTTIQWVRTRRETCVQEERWILFLGGMNQYLLNWILRSQCSYFRVKFLLFFSLVNLPGFSIPVIIFWTIIFSSLQLIPSQCLPSLLMPHTDV